MMMGAPIAKDNEACRCTSPSATRLANIATNGEATR